VTIEEIAQNLADEIENSVPKHVGGPFHGLPNWSNLPPRPTSREEQEYELEAVEACENKWYPIIFKKDINKKKDDKKTDES
jgi:hypothetical protein